jgi:apolipoprotein N-acyltransferase
LNQRQYLIGSLAALSLSAAWWFPGSLGCALLGWVAAALIVWIALRSQHPYRVSYLAGVLIHPLAFYWLFDTIRSFGGFPLFGAAAVFALFTVISGLQFPLFILLYRGLPKFLDGAGLRTALAWTTTEFIAIRIFPWCFGHTQLAVTPLAQAASLGGAYLVTFMMFWLAEVLLRMRLGQLAPRRCLAPAALIIVLAMYGGIQIFSFQAVSGPVQKVILVQANVSIEEKHDMRFVVANRDRYADLSRAALEENALIIWPETVIQDYLPNSVGSAINDPRLPFWQGSFTSFLLGAVTFDSREEIYNSAVAVYRDGTVPRPYHKRILMPFGEYTPFGKIFPWLKELNGMAGEFSAGTKPTVFEYPLDGAAEDTLAVSPLICFEDVVPGLSRESVQAGAELLVNLTNDGWFGNTIAPYQHHLIASFRAIENHRYLIRSTNTGLTGIVDPMGRTVSTLPPYSEGVLRGDVIPFSSRTVYSVLGDILWWVLVVLTSLSTVLVRVVRLRRAKRAAS